VAGIDGEEEFRARVALMRSLGVTRWGDIVLGDLPPESAAPAAPPNETPAERDARAETDRRERKRRHYMKELGRTTIPDALLEQLP
jgi:hypothetical protein